VLAFPNKLLLFEGEVCVTFIVFIPYSANDQIIKVHLTE
jgi:hypothetical protein